MIEGQSIVYAPTETMIQRTRRTSCVSLAKAPDSLGEFYPDASPFRRRLGNVSTDLDPVKWLPKVQLLGTEAYDLLPNKVPAKVVLDYGWSPIDAKWPVLSASLHKLWCMIFK